MFPSLYLLVSKLYVVSGLSKGNSIAKRLDRILMNNCARLKWSDTFVRLIPKFSSDQTSLLLCLSLPLIKIVVGVHFGLRLLSSRIQIFLLFMDENWSKESAATSALAHLRPKLIKSNKTGIGSIHEIKKNVVEELDRERAGTG
ncbi:hypothetical protein V2J09_017803 [Rumex salicifolius]